MIWITTIVLCLEAFPGLHHYEGYEEMLLRPPLAPAGVRFWWADPRVSTSPWGSLATQGSRFHWKQSSCFPSSLPEGHISELSGGKRLTTVACCDRENPVSTFSGL